MSAKTILSVEHKVKKSKNLKKAFEDIMRSSIYVGIANDSSKNGRKDGAPTNAQLGYIHERGSPAANIPPRPFLEPGVKSAKEKIEKGLERAAKMAMSGDEKGFEAQMERVALSSASAVKGYMRSGEFAPLSETTIRKRLEKIKKSGGTGSVIKPLIDTASLLNAIDGVVVKE
nr:MAG TPA: virion morphogenesis protein [Caudoviricetes sp.]